MGDLASSAWTSAEIEREAERLRAAYAATGDVRLARAAAALDPRGPGRPEIDDAAALARMQALLAKQPDLAVFTAARIVAREVKCRSDRSVARRLADKYRRITEAA